MHGGLAGDGPPGSRSRGLVRWALRIVFVLVVASGVLSVVPAPYVVVRSLDGIDARSLVVDGTVRAGEALVIPIVDTHRARWIEVLAYRATARARIERLDDRDLADGGRSSEHGLVSQRQLFRDSRQIGTLVGARLAGVDGKPTGDGVRVMAVGRHADRTPLRSGDVIVEAAGQPVRAIADLERVVRDAAVGTRLQVRLDGGRDLRLGPIPGFSVQSGVLRTAHALGVGAIETASPGVDGVDLSWRAVKGIDGTSAGLAYALAAYERLSGIRLGRGQVVYVTGEIGSEGGVWLVGGTREKAVAARGARADLLLVPAGQEEEVRRLAGGVRVEGVATVAEAVQLLGGSPDVPA